MGVWLCSEHVLASSEISGPERYLCFLRCWTLMDPSPSWYGSRQPGKTRLIHAVDGPGHLNRASTTPCWSASMELLCQVLAFRSVSMMAPRALSKVLDKRQGVAPGTLQFSTANHGLAPLWPVGFGAHRDYQT